MKISFVLVLIILMISTVCISSGFYSFPVKAESNSSWQISVSGLVSTPLNFTLADLLAMPQTNVTATLFCVSAPTVPLEGGTWQGVKLWTLLSQAGISSTAFKIAFYASDGFSTDLTIDVAKDDNIIVAYMLNGTPLSQGEITRLVVPGHYGYKWVDQITSIVAVDFDYTGTYESQGYPDDGLLTSTNLPSFPTPEIPYPPSVTPTLANSPTNTPKQSPSTSPTSLSTTTSPTQPTSPASTLIAKNLKAVEITVAAILIAIAVTAFVLKRRKKQSFSSSLSVTELTKNKELSASYPRV